MLHQKLEANYTKVDQLNPWYKVLQGNLPT